MSSLVLHMTCVLLLGVCIVLNRASLIDPKWPLLGIGLVMAAWVLLAFYTLLTTLWVLYAQSANVSMFEGVLAGMGVIPIVCVAIFAITVQKYPKIHDITTDTVNPPAFHYATDVRHTSHNSPLYRSGNALLQQEAYSHIQPLILELSPEQALVAAKALVQSIGWGIYTVDESHHYIEAYDKTAWLGFVDDVVIRVSQHEAGSRVDVRSASRIGLSDLGANAQRIDTFLQQLSGVAVKAN